jgi:hypothetical protein
MARPWEGNDALHPTAGEQRPSYVAVLVSSRAVPNPWTWTAAESGEADLHSYRGRERKGRRRGAAADDEAARQGQGGGRTTACVVRRPRRREANAGPERGAAAMHRVAQSEARRCGDKIADGFFDSKRLRTVGRQGVIGHPSYSITDTTCQEQGCNMFTTIET